MKMSEPAVLEFLTFENSKVFPWLQHDACCQGSTNSKDVQFRFVRLRLRLKFYNHTYFVDRWSLTNFKLLLALTQYKITNLSQILEAYFINSMEPPKIEILTHIVLINIHVQFLLLAIGSIYRMAQLLRPSCIILLI